MVHIDQCLIYDIDIDILSYFCWFQIDVRAHHVGLSWRLEMPNSCTAQAMFNELVADFGDWVTSGTCALLHWTSAEVDSPVEDVFTNDMHTELRLDITSGVILKKYRVAMMPTLSVTWQLSAFSEAVDGGCF